MHVDYVQIQIYSDSACTVPIHQADISIDFQMYWEGIGFNYHWGPSFDRVWYLDDLSYSTLQCVSDANQYSFAANKKYAVTE